MNGIHVSHLSKIYNEGMSNEVKALDDVSFDIEEGQFVVILGASGAGKSTLLNILGGMDRSTSGDYIVNESHVSSFSENELVFFRRKQIGFVFQFYNLMPNLSALENIELAASLSDDPLDSKEVLASVGLEKRANNFPSQLSGGEQQRVALARALVNNPSMLIADEPTGNLDPETAWDIMTLLNDINARGTTVVVATHAKDIVDKMNKRVIRIENGNIISDKKGGYDSEA